MRRFSALAVAAFLLFSVPTAQAFIYLAGTGYLKGERPVSQAPMWTGRVLRFYVNTDITVMGGSSPTTVTGAELLQAAQEAVAAWNVACKADIKIEVVGTTSATYNQNDSVNLIQWDNRTLPEGNYYNSTTILAAATTVLSGSEFDDCDIVMNGATATPLAFNPTPTDADLRSVLTHEIGHCLGLDHPIEPPNYDSANTFLTQATMVQTATLPSPDDTSRRDIDQDDRDGVECIYERGRPARTGVRCSSYHGTNGGGTIFGQTAITGGPTATDTICGTDAQGRNARPSEDGGDGCVPAAVAATGKPAPGGSTGLLRHLGSTWGLLSLIFLVFLIRRRRSLRYGVSVVALTAATFTTSDAKAWDLELSFAGKKIGPTQWITFASMDPTVSTWDRDPSPVEFNSQMEISAIAFHPEEDWGKWGWYGTFTLPKSLSTNAKATSAADQSKETSLWGFRVGPALRWFPNGGKTNSAHWYVGGKFGLGILMGSQSFESSSSGSVSYRAYSLELAASTGLEIPMGSSAKLAIEIGYSRLHSSYFSSTGNSGDLYSDFPSGTRLAVANGAGFDDLKFKSDGGYAAIGIQFPIGGESSKKEEKFDDYEGSTPAKITPAEKPTEKPAVPEEKPVVVPAPVVPKTPAEAPKPTPTPTATPRKSWEIDQPPEPGPGPGELAAPVVPPSLAVPTTPAAPAAPSAPNQADPVP